MEFLEQGKLEVASKIRMMEPSHENGELPPPYAHEEHLLPNVEPRLLNGHAGHFELKLEPQLVD
jgi:hypothetical protein